MPGNIGRSTGYFRIQGRPVFVVIAPNFSKFLNFSLVFHFHPTNSAKIRLDWGGGQTDVWLEFDLSFHVDAMKSR